MTSAPENTSHGSGPYPGAKEACFTWKSPDGLTLAGREWPAPEGEEGRPGPAIPVLCLPGLSRNTRDFNEIARFLQGCGHRVIALDYRGRGRSDWDSDWGNYTLPVEGKDIDAAIDQLALDRFALLGTSRGGLHGLVMGASYPATRMAAVILNDIGPHIEMPALHRIAATLGRNMKNSSLDAVAENLEQSLGIQFPSFDTADWRKLAGQLASGKDGDVVMDYDPALAYQLADLDDTAPAADLWPLYETLTDRPVLVLRGEHSDILSVETCRRMQSSHPQAECITVTGQGHAPVLWDRPIQDKIASFLKQI